MRQNAVKQALKAGQPAVGTWLSLGSITAARFMARAGFNWLTTDIEHSLVDWETATHMFATIADAGCVALARVPGIDAIFVGPNDLAQSMRSKDNKPPSAQATKEAMDHILKTCKKYGVAPGLHTGSADEANARIAEGRQFIAITSELKMMLNGAAAEVQKLPSGAKKVEMAKY